MKADYLVLAEEIAALHGNTAFRVTPRAQHTIFHALRLVNLVDAMMAYLGQHGEIDTRSELVNAVMNCLHDIDPQ